MNTGTIRCLIATLLCLAKPGLAAEMSLESAPPVVVKTVPVAGATDVDPGFAEVKVTFSKAMQDGSWSWAMWNEESFPEATGQPKYLKDARTCILPVNLQPKKWYAIWLNTEQLKEFKDAGGQPAVPYLLSFRTTESVPGAPNSVEGKHLMSLVADFFRHNFRDITSRESLEWGELSKDTQGNSSIRYKYRAKIWDKDTVTNNQVFTFSPQDKFVSVKDIHADPRERMVRLVEKFFGGNYRDITSRETLEWGEVVSSENGNASIRYKYRARIWDKTTVTNDQVFTFDAQDKCVSVKNASPATSSAPTAAVSGVASGFGPVMEATLKHPRQRVAELLDLDTGQRATSANFGDNDRETHAWIRTNRLDVLGVVEKGQIAILCCDMAVLPVPNERWAQAIATDVLGDERLAQLEPNKMTAISPATDKTDTWLFRTREGGHGILQIQGQSGDPLGVKVRYKLVAVAGEGSASPSR